MQNAPGGQPERRAGHGWPRAPRAASSPSPRACLGGPRPPQSVEPPPTRQGVISARAARRIRSRKTHLVLVFARRARGRARRESSVDSATLLASAPCSRCACSSSAPSFRSRLPGARSPDAPHRPRRAGSSPTASRNASSKAERGPASLYGPIVATHPRRPVDTCAHRSSRLARVDRRRRVCASPRATAGCPYCSFRSCDSPSGVL